MTMRALFLVLTCACAMGMIPEQIPFEDSLQSVTRAKVILEDNVLSMDGNIPLLNDPRRHYAEILYVIHHEAMQSRVCLGYKYEESYQKNLNTSVSYALLNPQGAVDAFKKTIADVEERIDKVLKLIKSVREEHFRSEEYNEEYYDDYETHSPVESYGLAWDTLLSAGLFTTLLEQYHKDLFDSHARNYTAQQFVITEAKALKKIVDSLSNLYLLLYSSQLPRKEC